MLANHWKPCLMSHWQSWCHQASTQTPPLGVWLALCCSLEVNTLRPRPNGHHYAGDPFKRIFLGETVRSTMDISLLFVPKGQINNIPAMVQIMAWRRPGNQPLSEPMIVRLPTHICVTPLQWVNLLSQYRPISQISQSIRRIPYNTQQCTYVHISVAKWWIVGYVTGALWDMGNMSKVPALDMETYDQCKDQYFYSGK